jgi:hypothetical protein
MTTTGGVGVDHHHQPCACAEAQGGGGRRRNEEQSRLLRLLNCDEMQGYLFCKPVPRETFETSYLGPLADK